MAALKVARGLPADAVVVVILPDGGRGYLAKVFNDTWMRSYGFMPRLEDAVGDLLTGTITKPQLTRVKSTQSIAEAVSIADAAKAKMLAVFNNEPPVRYGEIMGAIYVDHLKAGLAAGSYKPDSLVTLAMESRPIPLGITDTIATAKDALLDNPSAIVLKEGEVIALIREADLA
jgi:cystathionine beta-synthase